MLHVVRARHRVRCVAEDLGPRVQWQEQDEGEAYENGSHALNLGRVDASLTNEQDVHRPGLQTPLRHAGSVAVTVVQVRDVRMVVHDRRVPVRVGMWLEVGCTRRMRVLVVLVMDVDMVVLERIVRVHVAV